MGKTLFDLKNAQVPTLRWGHAFLDPGDVDLANPPLWLDIWAQPDRRGLGAGTQARTNAACTHEETVCFTQICEFWNRKLLFCRSGYVKRSELIYRMRINNSDLICIRYSLWEHLTPYHPGPYLCKYDTYKHWCILVGAWGVPSL